MSNHLGNVVAVITDNKYGVDTNEDEVAEYYEAKVVGVQDYYAFGMGMKERSAWDEGKYRYGFNGKESDKEVSEDIQDYGLRIYKAKLGKFLSVDPLAASFPWNSPYSFAENDVIRCIDLDGAERHNMLIFSDPTLGHPGVAILSIVSHYKVVTSGNGAVTNYRDINSNMIRDAYAKGNGLFYMAKLPTPTEEGEFLSGRHTRWAKRADAGDTKYAQKLIEAGITYYKLYVGYDYNVEVKSNTTLADAERWTANDPIERGIILSSMPLSQAMDRDARIFKMNVLANITFSRGEVGGASWNETGMESDYNIVFLNPNVNTQDYDNLGKATGIIIHEMGHNAAAENYHEKYRYTYNETGLQSNIPSRMYPTRRNTKSIMNDGFNRANMRVKRSRSRLSSF